MEVKIKKQNRSITDEELQKLTKEELIAKIRSIEAHNTQLQNIIAKATNNAPKLNPKGSYDFSKCQFRHILLHFLYLGWDYHGFAVQEDTTNTIENYIFGALVKTCLIKDRSSSNYHRCGRTDKGVSSFGQAISIDVRTKLSPENMDKLDKEIDYCKVLNRVLPEGILCVAWAPIAANFSARFDCVGRTYKYYFPKGRLNIEKMRKASKYLIGSHDFRNFAKMDVGNGVVQFVRHLRDFTIVPASKHDDKDSEYSIYVAVIQGNAFLWHQIRYIMGVLFLIGSEKEDPQLVLDLLNVNENPRKPDYNMASELPLNLFLCEYGDIEWYINQENIKYVLEKLQEIWTCSTIKSVMVKDMLNTVSKNLKDSEQIKCLSEYLVGGVKPKNYTPVMQRQKCESLQGKIENYAKRKRIEVVSGSDIV